MAFCSKCGAQIGDKDKFCPSCGAMIGAACSDSGANKNRQQTEYRSAESAAGQQNEQGFDPADVAQNKAMGILSYLGFLVLIPLLAAKNSKYARFHANQGLILFLTEACIGILAWIIPNIFFGLWYVSGIYHLLNALNIVFKLLDLACLGLSIYGIVNAAQGKKCELPVIGKIKLVK